MTLHQAVTIATDAAAQAPPRQLFLIADCAPSSSRQALILIMNQW